jgi:hypothetical protein
MQYMILIYGDPTREPAYGSKEFDAMMGGYFMLNEKMKADGVLKAVETMDGPFAETKEHLGGYYVIDVPDLDTALKYAAAVPAVAYGTVEVRPLMDYNPTAN